MDRTSSLQPQRTQLTDPLITSPDSDFFGHVVFCVATCTQGGQPQAFLRCQPGNALEHWHHRWALRVHGYMTAEPGHTPAGTTRTLYTADRRPVTSHMTTRP